MAFSNLEKRLLASWTANAERGLTVASSDTPQGSLLRFPGNRTSQSQNACAPSRLTRFLNPGKRGAKVGTAYTTDTTGLQFCGKVLRTQYAYRARPAATFASTCTNCLTSRYSVRYPCRACTPVTNGGACTNPKQPRTSGVASTAKASQASRHQRQTAQSP